MNAKRGTRIRELYEAKFPVSAKLATRAKQIFPDGVTHDSRHLEPFAVYVNRAQGSRKWTDDGVELIDYWLGHGSLILGHSHPAMVEAVQRQVALSTHPGASHELEIQWGEAVRRMVPCAERVRFVSSGTEATLMALRVSRIVTGRSKVMKFAGHFHGWHDGLIPGADAPHENSSYEMPGIPAGTRGDLVIVPPNDVQALATALDEHQPACLIMEGTGGHWGQVPMRGEFLREARKLTADRGILLIFDEVITGFRVSPGGSQEHYGIMPDLTTLAKILAGGLPGGCLCGKAEFMEAIQFQNRYGKKMKHPGTYNGNPLSAAAGTAVLNIVSKGEACRHASEMGKHLRAGLNDLFREKRANWIAYGDFSMFTILPEYDGPPSSGDEYIPCGGAIEKLDRKFDGELSHAFRCALLTQGVDLFGWRGMLSSEHTPKEIDLTISAFSRAIDLMREDRFIA